MKEKYYERLKTLSKEPNSSILFWGYEASAILKEIERLHSIIKEVREYITSYESIETIQQSEHSENNKGLDRNTMVEMANRYLKVHDKILEILDKENE